MYQFSEADWNLFRERYPEWQENYTQRLLDSYAKILAESGAPSEKFWALDRKLRHDKETLGVKPRFSRNAMHENILTMLLNEVITMDDLDGFSDGLRESVRWVKE